ncbi:MAG: J domain-containing protein [Caulobacteraceae bacterium]|nr:J domain-containing protein [Caulobacteraceae bacterium]
MGATRLEPNALASIADHYATLKIAPDADLEVVKAAYKALMLKHHPDRNRDDPNALARATQINAAYEILGDPDRRAAYDGDRAEASAAPSPSYEDFEDSWPSPPAQPANRRSGFGLPRIAAFLAAALVWRAIGAAAAVVALTAGGLYLRHELSSVNLWSDGRMNGLTLALEGAGGQGSGLAPVEAPAWVAPHIIHIPDAAPSHRRAAGPLAGLQTRPAAPHYSRQMIDGVVIYRRDDPWAWVEANYRRLMHLRWAAPTTHSSQ